MYAARGGADAAAALEGGQAEGAYGAPYLSSSVPSAYAARRVAAGATPPRAPRAAGGEQGRALPSLLPPRVDADAPPAAADANADAGLQAYYDAVDAVDDAKAALEPFKPPDRLSDLLINGVPAADLGAVPIAHMREFMAQVQPPAAAEPGAAARAAPPRLPRALVRDCVERFADGGVAARGLAAATRAPPPPRATREAQRAQRGAEKAERRALKVKENAARGVLRPREQRARLALQKKPKAMPIR